MNENEDIKFLLTMTEVFVGGNPGVKILENGNYSVIPLCSCQECGYFRSSYEPEASSTIVEALRHYASARIKYAEAVMASQQDKVKH